MGRGRVISCELPGSWRRDTFLVALSLLKTFRCNCVAYIEYIFVSYIVQTFQGRKSDFEEGFLRLEAAVPVVLEKADRPQQWYGSVQYHSEGEVLC